QGIGPGGAASLLAELGKWEQEAQLQSNRQVAFEAPRMSLGFSDPRSVGKREAEHPALLAKVQPTRHPLRAFFEEHRVALDQGLTRGHRLFVLGTRRGRKVLLVNVEW